MDVLPYLFIAALGVFAGILSGIGGGGAGTLMIPAFILVGLPPQTAVATGKMNGLGATLGGLRAFRKSGHIRKDIVKVMVPIAVVVGVMTPFVFSAVDSKLFQVILGVVLTSFSFLVLVKTSVPTANRIHKNVGYAAYTLVLSMQALFGSGVGMLSIYVQKYLLGTTSIQANATKRAISSVLTPITFIALLIGGYVSLIYGLVGFMALLIGTNIGTSLALRKGESFVNYFLGATSFVSGFALIITAL